jgi:Zinc finger, C2H2 type
MLPGQLFPSFDDQSFLTLDGQSFLSFNDQLFPWFDQLLPTSIPTDFAITDLAADNVWDSTVPQQHKLVNGANSTATYEAPLLYMAGVTATGIVNNSDAAIQTTPLLTPFGSDVCQNVVPLDELARLPSTNSSTIYGYSPETTSSKQLSPTCHDQELRSPPSGNAVRPIAFTTNTNERDLPIVSSSDRRSFTGASYSAPLNTNASYFSKGSQISLEQPDHYPQLIQSLDLHVDTDNGTSVALSRSAPTCSHWYSNSSCLDTNINLNLQGNQTSVCSNQIKIQTTVTDSSVQISPSNTDNIAAVTLEPLEHHSPNSSQINLHATLVDVTILQSTNDGGPTDRTLEGIVTAQDADLSISTTSPISTASALPKPTSLAADTGTYSCTYHGCLKRFATSQQLQKHKREHRNNPNLTPGVGSGMSAAQLMKRNSQSGPHKCERIDPTTGKPCNGIFSRPYDLTRHEDTIHNPRKQKVRCAFCSSEEKTFSRTDALTRHMRVMHPEVYFPGKHSERNRSTKDE